MVWPQERICWGTVTDSMTLLWPSYLSLPRHSNPVQCGLSPSLGVMEKGAPSGCRGFVSLMSTAAEAIAGRGQWPSTPGLRQSSPLPLLTGVQGSEISGPAGSTGTHWGAPLTPSHFPVRTINTKPLYFSFSIKSHAPRRAAGIGCAKVVHLQSGQEGSAGAGLGGGSAEDPDTSRAWVWLWGVDPGGGGSAVLSLSPRPRLGS